MMFVLDASDTLRLTEVRKEVRAFYPDCYVHLRIVLGSATMATSTHANQELVSCGNQLISCSCDAFWRRAPWPALPC